MVTSSFFLVTAVILIIAASAKNQITLFKRLLVLLIFLDLNQITSTAMQLGAQEINCGDIALVAALLSAILLLSKKNPVDKKILMLAFLLPTFVVLGLLLGLAFPYGGETVSGGLSSWDAFFYGLIPASSIGVSLKSALVLIRLIFFLVILCAMSATLRRKDCIFVGEAVASITVLHIAFGALEALEKWIAHSNYLVGFAQVLLPSPASYGGIIERGGLPMLQGLTREPSNFALMLTLFLILIILLRKSGSKRKIDFPISILAVTLLGMSSAFTAVFGIVVLVVFLLFLTFREWKHRVTSFDVRIPLVAVAIAAFSVVLLLVFLDGGSYYAERLHNVVNNLSTLVSRQYGLLSGSPDSMPRLISIVESFYVFLSKPLLGVGIGVMNSFGGFFTMLANLGLIGTGLWLALVGRYANVMSGKGSSVVLGFLIISLGLFTLAWDIIYTPFWLLFAGILPTCKKDELLALQNEHATFPGKRGRGVYAS